MAKPAFREIERWSPNNHGRGGRKVTNFFLHTQEGDGTAQSLAGYLQNPASQVSYHYTVDNAGVVCDVVDTDYCSWSVLDANPISINLCFAGSRASWSRSQWLGKMGRAIDIAAYLAVQDCKKYGIPTTVITPPYRRAAGISDHRYVTRVLGMGTHTDVGDGFPWDVFAKAVSAYASGHSPAPVVPVVNQIDVEAKAAAWLGKRLHDGERKCKDGVGRYADFEHGSVYWHPKVNGGKATAIPANIFETYKANSWEQGFLGYPTKRHTVITGVGDVQAFQGGVIYRKYGEDGHPVRGVIGDRWAKEGYEVGPLGWPISDEYDYDGGKRQDFENGSLTWSPTGAVREMKR